MRKSSTVSAGILVVLLAVGGAAWSKESKPTRQLASEDLYQFPKNRKEFNKTLAWAFLHGYFQKEEEDASGVYYLDLTPEAPKNGDSIYEFERQFPFNESKNICGIIVQNKNGYVKSISPSACSSKK